MHRRCASWHNVPLHTAKPCFIISPEMIETTLHFMDHVDKIDKMDFSVLRQKNKIVHQVHQVHQVHLKHRLHI